MKEFGLSKIKSETILYKINEKRRINSGDKKLLIFLLAIKKTTNNKLHNIKFKFTKKGPINIDIGKKYIL